jgi:hypothetical protein
VSVSESTVSQREFDRYAKATDDAIARVERDLQRLADERDDDIRAAVAIAVASAIKDAFNELADKQDKSWVRRLGFLSAAAGVASAWVAILVYMRGH